MALCYLTVTNDVVQEVVDSGVVPRLVALLDNNDANSVIFPALRTIGNIVTGIQTTVAGAYPLLAKLLLVNSSTNTFWYEATVFASRIADCNAAETQALITSNVILPLGDVLSKGDFKRQKETALVISNITLGNLFQFDC
jgi:importin subunit alpha-2